MFLIGTLETNFSEISIEINTFSFKKMHLKESVKWQPVCLGLYALITGKLVWQKRSRRWGFQYEEFFYQHCNSHDKNKIVLSLSRNRHTWEDGFYIETDPWCPSLENYRQALYTKIINKFGKIDTWTNIFNMYLPFQCFEWAAISCISLLLYSRYDKSLGALIAVFDFLMDKIPSCGNQTAKQSWSVFQDHWQSNVPSSL